nr:hypothetical protein [Clostridia bacterium]
MDEKKRSFNGLFSDLAGVVSDLCHDNAAALARLSREVAELPEVTPVQPATPAPEAMPAPEKPALPPFEALWKTADEPIDWTEALASPTPTDGLTDPAKWALYHEQAASVLHGDMSAYKKVLAAANPTADLTPFVGALDVQAQDSETLRAVFTVRDALMADAPRRYLSGMALRIARDLFAVLPVTAVTVEGRQEAQTLLTVSFERSEMNKVRFAFVEPVDFVTKCGGTFSAADL